MELGGNAPCIVFDDADIDIAVKGSVRLTFTSIFVYVLAYKQIKSSLVPLLDDGDISCHESVNNLLNKLPRSIIFIRLRFWCAK